MLTLFLVVSNKKTFYNLLLSCKITYDALNICGPRDGTAGGMAVVVPSVSSWVAVPLANTLFFSFSWMQVELRLEFFNFCCIFQHLIIKVF